jgi:two-component system, OmpR family, phosphate regulon sensor histidine kinase PhoR
MTLLDWITLIAAATAISLLAWRWRAEHARAEQWQTVAVIADRRLVEARQKLEQFESQIAALEVAQIDGLLVLNAQGKILRLNAAAREILGSGAVPGESLMTASRSAELDEIVAAARDNQGEMDAQIGLAGLPYRVRARVADGGIVVVVLREMSELQRLGRARRDFIANISHELRTPLTSVRLVVESLLTGVTRSPDEIRTHLEKINTEIAALEQMSQELLDLAQIESGQALVRLVPVQVRELMATAVNRLQPQADRKHQVLTVHVAEDLEALADLDQISRALGNLVHNAIKFTNDGGTIRLAARRQDSDIVVTVSDNGPGIAGGDQPRVFERFFRGDRARLRQSGTGLGLAIAKHVVEAHGGRIWVESEGIPGRGTTFFFTLLPSS